MKVLIVTGSFPPMRCGVGDYTECLADALGKREHMQVAVLTDAAASQTSFHPNYQLLPILKGWTFADLPRILGAVRDWRPDIIHIQYPTQGYAHKLLPWLLPTIFGLRNLRVVQTWHEYLPMGAYRRNFLLAASSRAVVVVRPNYADKVPPALRLFARRIRFQFIPGASSIPVLELTDAERIAARAAFVGQGELLVAFFGFAYPPKGVDLLFDLLDPARHRLVLICELDFQDAYHQVLLDRIKRAPWKGNVTVTGFLKSKCAAKSLAAADAAVFPFREGGGIWNSSIHAASAQGTFVVTTSNDRHGYFPSENIYYARPGDIADMRSGLESHIGQKNNLNSAAAYDWGSVASAHAGFYETMLDRSVPD